MYVNVSSNFPESEESFLSVSIRMENGFRNKQTESLFDLGAYPSNMAMLKNHEKSIFPTGQASIIWLLLFAPGHVALGDATRFAYWLLATSGQLICLIILLKFSSLPSHPSPLWPKFMAPQHTLRKSSTHPADWAPKVVQHTDGFRRSETWVQGFRRSLAETVVVYENPYTGDLPFI